VRTVDVGVGHDDDLVVAGLARVEVLPPDAGAQRSDQDADLFGRDHLVESGLLDVQDLALEGEDRLVLPVAPLLGGSSGGVAFHQNSSESAGSRSWQSASFPGARCCPRRFPADQFLGLRAASRARAAFRISR
jgi:hypothetical protein